MLKHARNTSNPIGFAKGSVTIFKPFFIKYLLIVHYIPARCGNHHFVDELFCVAHCIKVYVCMPYACMYMLKNTG